MMTLKEHRALKESVRKMIYEALEYENIEFERKKGEHHKKPKKNKEGEDAKARSKRAIVLKWLKDPALNCAEIMRELWHPGDSDDEDAKRSYFYKCRDGELNDAGQPYSFTDEDITSLYKIKTSSQE